MNFDTTENFSIWLRKTALQMTHKAQASHIGSCLSIADILAVLYGEILKIDPKNPEKIDRDRFILSKGHAASIVYAALAAKEFFPLTWLDDYCQENQPLSGHLTHHSVPGVEISTGSLGHGLPIASGMAMAAKRSKSTYKIYVLMSDGECDEGSNWEAALFAGHHKLDNLVAIIDYNKIQSFGRIEDVITLEPLAEKWRAFGWAVEEIDGHNNQTLKRTFSNLPLEKEKPNIIIAHTVKGKGVSFIENQLAWHYKTVDKNQLELAIKELENHR